MSTSFVQYSCFHNADTSRALLASWGASSRDLASVSSADRKTHCAIPKFLILKRLPPLTATTSTPPFVTRPPPTSHLPSPTYVDCHILNEALFCMASGGDDSRVLGCRFADAFSECCPLELVREENEWVLSGGCPPQAIEINVINFFLVTFQCLAERHRCVSDPWSDGREIYRWYNVFIPASAMDTASLCLSRT